ncbi:mucin-2-like [Paramacrobiotus metropolitanus]|uniref:mucin-2-like n=1 Tax=Paramacrobiotus metropolitanus TaxID=2943436 RepID=UPI002445E21E|nr:mucin-2-like [Paramacrobiotus metropolitanus]
MDLTTRLTFGLYRFIWALIAFCISSTGAHEIRKRQSQPVVCGQPLYTGAVVETAQPGTFILRASATDTAGIPLTWSIPDTSLRSFQINPTTGDITTALQLSRRFTRSALEFRIRASETGTPANYCEAAVRLNILPVTGPGTSASGIFSQTSYTFTASTCAVGATVGTITPATTTTGVTYTYTIPSGNSYFSVNPTSGLITLIAIPPTGTQTFSVTATGSTGTTGTVPVTVSTTCSGTGTTGLTFSQPSYTFTQTTCIPGSIIGAVSAFSTTGGTVTYTLPTGNGLFTINPTTGQITSLSTTSLGTQTLTVQAISSTGQTATAMVLISSVCSGTGIGTGAPVFTQPFYSFTAATCTVGGTVGQIQAISSFPVTYLVFPTNPYYSVNPTTGVITIIAVPPAGIAQTLTVQAISTSGIPATATISITGCTSTGIISGTAPVFQQAVYSFTATVCTAGYPIGQVVATSATGLVTYTGTSPYFSVNPTTGQITAITTPPSGVQTIQVTAVSSSGQSASTLVTINTLCTGTGIGTGIFPGIGLGIGGTVPTFVQPFYSFTVTSCTSGTAVGSVTAQSPYGIPVYSIDAANGGTNPYFAISPQSGSISLIGTPPSGYSQQLTVRAQASGYTASVPVNIAITCSGTSTGTIGITGSTSGLFSQSSYSFSAGACTPGAQVGQVTANVPAGTTVTYTINSGNNGQYIINPSSGIINAATQLSPGVPSTLTVSAISTSGQSGTANVIISPTCNGQQLVITGSGGAPTFSQSSYSFPLSTCTAGSVIGSVAANVPGGGQVSYTLTGSQYFGINPGTGQVGLISVPPTGTYPLTINALSTSGQTATTTATVTASCSGAPILTSNTGVNTISSPGVNTISNTGVIGTNTVNANPLNNAVAIGGGPVFNQSSYQCSASCSTDSARVCVVRATNSRQDSMDYGLSTSNQFYIDSSSGEIRTITAVRGGGTFSLAATATDPFGNRGTAPVTITIVGC